MRSWMHKVSSSTARIPSLSWSITVMKLDTVSATMTPVFCAVECAESMISMSKRLCGGHLL